MPALKNPRWETACQARAKGESQTDSYAAAGFARNGHSAYAFFKKEPIASRVREIQESRVQKMESLEIKSSADVAKKLGISKEKIISALMLNAQQCMHGIPVLDREGNEIGRKRDSMGANRALQLIGSECFGMFIERHEIGGPGDFAKMTDEELAKRIEADAEALGMTVEGLPLLFGPVEKSETGEE